MLGSNILDVVHKHECGVCYATPVRHANCLLMPHSWHDSHLRLS